MASHSKTKVVRSREMISMEKAWSSSVEGGM